MSKDFSEQLKKAGSPAMDYISVEQPEQRGNRENRRNKKPADYERIKRISVSIKPSLHAKAQEKADKLGMSFSRYITRLIEEDLREE